MSLGLIGLRWISRIRARTAGRPVTSTVSTVLPALIPESSRVSIVLSTESASVPGRGRR